MIPTTFVQWVAVVPMAKPSFMVAISLPGHHGEAQDEDNLNREQDDSGGDDGDVATEAILSIVNHLKNAKASAVRDVRAFADSLYKLCDAFMAKDYHAVGDAADAARDALHNLISED